MEPETEFEETAGVAEVAPSLGQQKPVSRNGRKISKEQRDEMRRQALVLRTAGANYKQIAKQVNCSLAYAYELVQRALKEARPIEQPETIRRVELERLDVLHMRLWPLATGSSGREPNYNAVDKVLKVAELRYKLLGLDVHRHEFLGEGGAPMRMAPVILLPAEDRSTAEPTSPVPHASIGAAAAAISVLEVADDATAG